MRYDVFGMCNALFDIQAEVTEAQLREMGLTKGAMVLIDQEQQRRMVPRIYSQIVNAEPGGSGANTLIGLAQLGGTGCYTSHVGDDEHGQLYREGLEARGIRACLGSSPGETGICLVLITPDAQRTLATFLGRSQNLRLEDLCLEDLQASRYLYATAYLWDTPCQKETVQAAMGVANAAGVRVALSLSDPFCVTRHRDELLDLIRTHVDVLFGNQTEAEVLTDTDNPHDAARVLAEFSDVAVVTMDARGSLIRQGAVVHEIPACAVKAVDTTGAGDMYAAGLLYGLTQGLPLDVTGRIASYCAAQVVAQIGPRVDALNLDAVRHLRAGGSLFEVCPPP